ncbi:type II toxin-antitoxin system RelE/ParE family toxin [Actinomyces sp. zg296]|uniref:type II toxin-antitoxin system RelE/ParE family toxin n=1 Tax=Actinomyces sp. zg296 TaxID=2609289 RepID=UPI001F288460|nr:type II toxin-antitoxin system YafQ family toxin [Actinomyces sp. zg296]
MHRSRGDWKGSYECHVANAGDWLVAWRSGNDVAVLVRTGTHEEIAARLIGEPALGLDAASTGRPRRWVPFQSVLSSVPLLFQSSRLRVTVSSPRYRLSPLLRPQTARMRPQRRGETVSRG